MWCWWGQHPGKLRKTWVMRLSSSSHQISLSKRTWLPHFHKSVRFVFHYASYFSVLFCFFAFYFLEIRSYMHANFVPSSDSPCMPPKIVLASSLFCNNISVTTHAAWLHTYNISKFYFISTSRHGFIVLKGPSLYYVSTFLNFFWPIHSPYVSKTSAKIVIFLTPSTQFLCWCNSENQVSK